jgi:hypothetical protein
MASEQCAQNADGSLKDAKDIVWFNDPDDPQPLPPLPSTPPPNDAQPLQADQVLPSTVPPARSLGRGRRNKVTNRFTDAVARERLGSDEDDTDALAKQPSRGHIPRIRLPARAPHAPHVLGGTDATSDPSSGLFDALPEESSDGDDASFRTKSGSESGDSGHESTELELISGNEVCVLVIPTIVRAHLSFSLLMHCRGRPSLMSAVVNASNFDRSPRTNARLSRRHLACQDQHQSVLVSQKEGLLISKRAVSVPPPPWHQLSLWSGR